MRDLDQIATVNRRDYPFFPVSPDKLVVMSLATFGLYEVFWTFKNWDQIRIRKDPDIRPVWRTFFTLFYIYFLFKEMCRTLAQHEIKPFFSPFTLTVLYIGFYFLLKLPDPYSLLSFLGVLPLAVVQKEIQELQLQSGIDPTINSYYSKSNIIGIVVGGFLWFIVILGMFIPE